MMRHNLGHSNAQYLEYAIKLETVVKLVHGFCIDVP